MLNSPNPCSIKVEVPGRLWCRIDLDLGYVLRRKPCTGGIQDTRCIFTIDRVSGVICLVVVVPVTCRDGLMHVPLAVDGILRHEKEPHTVCITGYIFPVGIPGENRITLPCLNIRGGENTRVRQCGLETVTGNEHDIRAFAHAADKAHQVSHPGTFHGIGDLVSALGLIGLSPDILRVHGDTLVPVLGLPITDDHELLLHLGVVEGNLVHDRHSISSVLDDMDLRDFGRYSKFSKLDLGDLRDTHPTEGPVRLGQCVTDQLERPLAIGQRGAILGGGNDIIIAPGHISRREVLGIPVRSSYGYLVPGRGLDRVELVRDPVIDPAGQEPERDAGPFMGLDDGSTVILDLLCPGHEVS